MNSLKNSAFRSVWLRVTIALMAAAPMTIGCAGGVIADGDIAVADQELWRWNDWEPNGMDGLIYSDAFIAADADTKVFLAANQRSGNFYYSEVVCKDCFGGNDANYFPADFNGDNRVDLGYLETGNYSFHVATRTLDNKLFGPGSGQWVPPGTWGHANGRYHFGNFDGTYGDDLAFFEQSDCSFYVLLANKAGNGFTGSGRWSLGEPKGFTCERNNYYPGDFNCDGKSDLGFLKGDSSFWVSLSTGTGFDTPKQWIGPNAFGHANGRYLVGGFYGYFDSGNRCDDLAFFEPGNKSFYIARSLWWMNKFAPENYPMFSNMGDDRDRYQVAYMGMDSYADVVYVTPDSTLRVMTNYGGGWYHWFDSPTGPAYRGSHYFGKRSR